MNSSWPKSSTKRTMLGIKVASHHTFRDLERFLLVVECLVDAYASRQRPPVLISFDRRSARLLAADVERAVRNEVGQERGVSGDDDLSGPQFRSRLQVLGDERDPPGMDPVLRLLEPDQGRGIFRPTHG